MSGMFDVDVDDEEEEEEEEEKEEEALALFFTVFLLFDFPPTVPD